MEEENKNFKRMGNYLGEYAVSVIRGHLSDLLSRINHHMCEIGKDLILDYNGQDFDLFMKKKTQNLSPAKQEELWKIYSPVANNVKDFLGWFEVLDNKMAEIHKIEKPREVYLQIYGHERGPWGILCDAKEEISRSVHLMGTVQRALEDEDEDFSFTIITASEICEKAKEKVSRVMDFLSGNDLKKAV